MDDDELSSDQAQPASRFFKTVLVYSQSNRRLLLAIALSTAMLMTLVAILPGFIIQHPCKDQTCFDGKGALGVVLVEPDSEPIAEIEIPAFERRSISKVQPATTLGRALETGADFSDTKRKTEAPIERTSEQDWYNKAKVSARQTVDSRMAQEEIRQSMWNATGSVMFKDSGEFDLREEQGVISDREFRIPLGVLGIGVTIGGCFFGIPLAGVPVERRTAGPNVIYCSNIYE